MYFLIIIIIFTYSLTIIIMMRAYGLGGGHGSDCSSDATAALQYQSCQRNDPPLLDQPVVLYSIIILLIMMVMMMTMIPLTTVREFCFEFSLRESNERKTNQQDRFQHLFLSENASLLFFQKRGDKSTELLSTSCFCKLLILIKIKLLIFLRTLLNNK